MKPQPNRKRYLEILRNMTPQERLNKAFELSQFGKDLFLAGLCERFPEYTEQQIIELYIERVHKCNKKNSW